MNILVVAPHMDDEVLGMGGTMLRHAVAGDQVHVCYVTRRAYGHAYDPERTAADQDSARRAAAILGCTGLTFLDLEDERLDRCVQEVLIPLETCLVALNPDVLYTCHPGDLNQDHRAVAHASFIAARPAAQGSLRRVLCYETLSSTDQAPPFPGTVFAPNTYVDIAAQLEAKVEALRQYPSEMRPFPHPRSGEAVRALAAKRGSESNLTAAEAFTLVRDVWRP